MKKKTIRFSAIILLILSLTVFLGDDIARSQARRAEERVYQQLELFSEVFSLVQKMYVEPVDSQKLIYGALKGMLSSLDPYSQFLEPDLYRELEIETEGHFGGVGMIITLKEGLVTVVSPLEDTPAFRAGVKPNDRIIRIGDKPTRGMDSNEAAKLLRGEPGTKVDIEILREGAPEVIKLSLVREMIKLQSVKKAQFLPDSKVGYVRLVEFQKDTYQDLKTALEKLVKDEVEGIILDLRNNPGGLLDSAVDVASLFLPKGALAVYTQGREKENRLEYKTGGTPVVPSDIPVVVLINAGSASASEIVAGALSDYKRAILLGEKSFGKGSVQTVIPLPEKAAVKLTIARYYTPKGRVIEGNGLPPDIEVPYEVKEFLPDAKVDLASDPQLQRALDLLKGLTILKK